MLPSCLRHPGRIAFSIAMLGLAIGLGLFNGLGRLDAIVYGAFAATTPSASTPEVVVVVIGPDCAKQVGRWPWAQDVHVQLIERISAQAPLALGVDMVLAVPTPDRPAGQRLAVAMARTADALPPMLTAVLAGRSLVGEAAFESMVEAAVHAERASERSAVGALRHNLLAGAGVQRWWQHLAVGTIDTAWVSGTGIGDVAMWRDPAAGGLVHRVSAIRTSHPAQPSAAPAYLKVTAGNVLSGKVPPDVFRDRLVVVGMASSGMLDARALMRSGPVQVTGGVDMSAGIADVLWQSGREIEAEGWQNGAFTAAFAALLLTAMWSQPPGRALKASVAIMVLGMALAYAAWRVAGVWFAPGALLVVALPLFAMLTHRLSSDTHPAAEAVPSAMAARLHPAEPDRPRSQRGSGLASRDASVNGQAHRPREGSQPNHGELQSLRDFLMAAIESLPDIILVCQASGQVVIGNQAAARYFGLDAAALRGQRLLGLLERLTPAPGFAWGGTDGEFEFPRHQHGVECRDASGAEFLLKCAPCGSVPFEKEGWIVSLVDVGALRDAERRRDDAMRFLSHDMRSPLTAILALLTLQREGDEELPQAEILSRIRRLASRSLALAESFVQLARAEPLEHAREPLDLADIVMDAADDCWSQAQAKRITIDVDVPPNAAQTEGDRELVRRAVINLVNNAVKYSPRGSRVVCAVYRIEDEWCVAIRDEGRGIAFEDRERLFKKFVRLGEREPDAEPGIGLGLAFTKTVVDRHGGRIEVDSVLGVGSEFRFYLKAIA
jgi:signal transduction histidine kinase/CHASE2 domain-containing sensor protein